MASPLNEQLLSACEQGRVPLIKQLLMNGADPNCVDDVEYYQTPLSYAAASGSAEAVRVLLDGGADITESSFAFFSAEGDDNILALLVRANPRFAFKEFDELEFVKGTQYEVERRALQRAGWPPHTIDSAGELQRISHEIGFAQKIKSMAKQLRGGRRSSSRSSRKKSTYRRRTFKR